MRLRKKLEIHLIIVNNLNNSQSLQSGIRAQSELDDRHGRCFPPQTAKLSSSQQKHYSESETVLYLSADRQDTSSCASSLIIFEGRKQERCESGKIKKLLDAWLKITRSIIEWDPDSGLSVVRHLPRSRSLPVDWEGEKSAKVRVDSIRMLSRSSKSLSFLFILSTSKPILVFWVEIQIIEYCEQFPEPAIFPLSTTRCWCEHPSFPSLFKFTFRQICASYFLQQCDIAFKTARSSSERL